jgi:hypothetical protein
METLADFVARLIKDVGCYYHENNPHHYSIKKYDTMIRKEMGNLGWIGGKKKIDIFWIASPKQYADKAKLTHLDYDEIKHNNIYAKEGVGFFVKRDSHGKDYQKAVKALKAIKDVR